MPEDEHSSAFSMNCLQRAYLSLRGDVATGGTPHSVEEQKRLGFDPDDVTRLVGLQPTEASRRGDPHPRRPAPARLRSSDWIYELPKVRTYVTEDVVTQLLDAIEPHAAGIAEACATLGLRAKISVVIEMSGVRDPDGEGINLSTAAISYTGETLKRLARLNLLYIDHDQYVYLLE
jgi:hypothetical protein